MKIKKLIECLSKLDPELNVLVLADDGYYYDIGGKVQIGYVQEGIALDPKSASDNDRVAILSCQN